MTLIDEYLEEQEKFEKKYGEKTIILMEVGSFFEIYGIHNENCSKGRIYEIAELLNLTVSKKNDKYSPVSEKNPLMAGFPNHSFEKWKDILLKYDYTIIKIEQDSHGTKNPTRKITEILSPGVNIETNNFSNNMMSVYIEEILDHKSKNPLLIVGISIIDITTGETTVYETYSKHDDYRYCLDEIFRFIQSFTPIEILIHSVNIQLSKDELISYLEVHNYNIHYNTYEKDIYLLQNKYKNNILKIVYPNTGMLNPIEYIDLEKSPFALNSYIYLIQFIYEHNENIIEKLEKPKIWEPSSHLILSHDSINQLNILPDKNRANNKGISSLWNVLDKTITTLGRRKLRDSLLNPIMNKEELSSRYELVHLLSEEYKDDIIYKQIRKLLKNINDIERLHRKMAVSILNPHDFVGLDISYSSILDIINLINKISNDKLSKIIPDKKYIILFKEFIGDYKEKLKMENIYGININNLRENIFVEGVYEDIDKIQNKIEFYNSYFKNLAKGLSNLINKKMSKNDNSDNLIDIKFSDKEGHFLSTTKSREKEIKLFFSKSSKFTFEHGNKVITIDKKDIEYKNTATSCKIYTEQIRNYSSILLGEYDKLRKMCNSKFSELLQSYYIRYNKTLKELVNFVSYLDFISCIAHVSYENGYVRPIIDDDLADSNLEAENLRHPIIEKINTQIKYVPNDIILGKDNKKGMLLYGVNAVGKSSFMKSVGLSIIMAQTGFYVPAKKFIYNPYKYLFTRISNNDNIFKGQSTFAVEMSELRSILKRSNNQSLVLGDELCSGTETTSGLSIVTAGVVRLSDNRSSFIFATHLHQLSEMTEIIEKNDVENYHMETKYDIDTKKLIYDRKLKKGSGSSIYGLEVARAMDLDKDFIEIANKIRNRLLDRNEMILNNKVSHFNSEIILSNCAICKKKTEEVHHIEEQHLANKDGMIDYFHKNNLFNLVQLCHECHQDVHHYKIKINGYVSTSDGIELSYEKVTKENDIVNNRKKYNKDQIDIIRDIHTKMKVFKTTKKVLEQDYNINISTSLIKKIAEGVY